ncbi:MAG: CoB--CoM heterodisulfide reductase, partial [Desulfobacterales bacterium]|nr:CoB--CoM heterodisulfide reductase [Desulfobacterales bacterium]
MSPIAYYPGCSLRQSSLFYDEQTRTIFQHLQIPLMEIEDWSCCGATSAGKMDEFMAIAMPARNIGIAEYSGYKEMLIPCSACYSRTIVAKQKMLEDKTLSNEINTTLARKVKAEIQILSILDLLIRCHDSGILSEKLVKPLKGLKAV